MQSTELDKEVRAYFNGADSARLVELLDQTMRQAEGRVWRTSFGIWVALILVAVALILMMASIMGGQ